MKSFTEIIQINSIKGGKHNLYCKRSTLNLRLKRVARGSIKFLELISFEVIVIGLLTVTRLQVKLLTKNSSYSLYDYGLAFSLATSY
jgi:Tfp pilus assembly protein PilX